jgi:hypothetical protein
MTIRKIEFRVGPGAMGIVISATLLLHWYLAIPKDAAAGYLIPAAALLIQLLRKGTWVDREKRQATRWWGLRLFVSLPVVSKRREIGGESHVRIRRDFRASSEDSGYTAYVVSLGSFDVCESRSHLESRRRAEALADYLGLGMRDESGGEAPSIRAAGTLDMPATDRPTKESRAPTPDPSRVTSAHEGGRRIIEGIRPTPRDRANSAAFIGTLAAVAAVLLFELGLEENRLPLGYFVAVAVGCLGAMALCALLAATRRVRLIVDSSRLILKKSWVVGSWTKRMSAAEVEELDVGASRSDSGTLVLSARGDRRSIEFGAGLRKEELQWIRAEALRALRGS